MRVTIVIAAHNEGVTLWRTVASCVETCAELDYEIVIADDASLDGSIEQATQRFPQVRVVRNDERQGASPAKALGAEHARGEVLVFLDGHTKPEYGAIARMVEDIGRVKGEAVVVPQIPALDAQRWKNNFAQSGSGYRIDLTTFACGWVPLDKMSAVQVGRKEFYESPALIGCALAVHRELYEKLWGFDRKMRLWGVEDLDFGLKCWLMGSRILHDPQAVVGHRFRATFDNYSAPIQNIAANQLRMARKNFSQSVWEDWLDRARQRQPERLQDHPEGLWAHIWQIFESDRESVERERAYLLANRSRDEFWYADRFGLAWPVLGAAGKPKPSIKLFEAEGSPSPPPPGKCRIYTINPAAITLPVMTVQEFKAAGYELDDIEWDTGGKGTPEGQTDNPFWTQFNQPGNAVVTAKCPDGPSKATSLVTAVKVLAVQYTYPGAGWAAVPDPLYVMKGSAVKFRATKSPAAAKWPKGTPTWGGTSGASGTAEQVSVSFNAVSANPTDYKTVTATCGNTETANVIVYDLIGTLTPVDNFAKRATDRYGLRELVDLDFETVPTGITAEQIGGLKWALDSTGTGEFADKPPLTDKGTGRYIAGHKPATATLALRATTGPSKGMGPTFQRQLVEPQGGRVETVPADEVPDPVYHCEGFFAIGILGYFFLTPTDVSFSQLLFREGFAKPAKTGWFADTEVYPPGEPEHPAWAPEVWKPIGPGNKEEGCKVIVPPSAPPTDNMDRASFDRMFTTPKFKKGKISLSIPWEYSTDGGKNFVAFNKHGGVPFRVVQSAEVDKAGEQKITKGNATATRALDAASNNPNMFFPLCK